MNNKKLAGLEAQAQALQAQIDALENSQWHYVLQDDAERATNNTQFAQAVQDGEAFADSVNGQALKKELEELIDAAQRHIDVSDVPARYQ